MMEKKDIEKFYNDLTKLDLRFPHATIVKETGFSKSMVSNILNRTKEPSANFLKKFYDKFFTERNILEEDDVLQYGKRIPDAPVEDQWTLRKLLQIIDDQSSTIKSQQETIHMFAADMGKTNGRQASA